MTDPMNITPKDLDLHAAWLRGAPDGVRLVRIDANLSNANLRGAYFRGADLSNADLSGADLIGTNLSGANLSDADLRSANLIGADLIGADLIGADLSDANLSGANLSGANLSYANFRGANGLAIAADAADRLKAVAATALQPDALEMGYWHTCGTTHCIAGWAIHLAGEPGRSMELMMGSELAGLLLLGTEAHQHFHDSNEKALEYLREVAA